MTEPTVAEAAAGFTSADLADAAADPRSVRGLVRYAGTGTVAGVARTVRAEPGDARSVHEAILQSAAGDVIVVDFGGPDVPAAGLGELVCAEAVRRGVRGVVFWGPLRDVVAIRELDLAVFATGTEPMPGVHLTRGELGARVEISGVHVDAGDLVVADDDGVVVVARADVADALERARQLRAMDRGLVAAVLAGTPLAELPDYRAYVDAVDERRAGPSDPSEQA